LRQIKFSSAAKSTLRPTWFWCVELQTRNVWSDVELYIRSVQWRRVKHEPAVTLTHGHQLHATVANVSIVNISSSSSRL